MRSQRRDEGELRTIGGRSAGPQEQRSRQIAGGRFPLTAAPPTPRRLPTRGDPDRPLLTSQRQAPRFFICGIQHVEGFAPITNRPWRSNAHGSSECAAIVAAPSSGAAPTMNRNVNAPEAARTLPSPGPDTLSNAGAGSSKYMILTMRR